MSSPRRAVYKAMVVLGCATAVVIAVAGFAGDTSPLAQTATAEPMPAADPTASNATTSTAAERVLIEQHDDAHADTARHVLAPAFSAAQWKIAELMLAKPNTSLVACEVVRIGVQPGMRLRDDAPEVGLKAGDVAHVFDNTNDVLEQWPELQLAAALRAGQERAVIIRRHWWRWHLLMVGR